MLQIRPAPAKRSWSVKFLTSFSIALAACLITVASIEAQPSPTKITERTKTEEWIMEQVTNGTIADLTKRFPNEADRKLSANFLEDLLTGAVPGIKAHRNGVQINGAIINEPVNLTNAQFISEVWLNHCRFTATATFERAIFTGTVSFEETVFQGDANFDSIRVGGDVLISKAVFEERVNFRSADIARDFVANKAQFKNKIKTASFRGMKVKGYVFLKNTTVFEGPVDFTGTEISGDFIGDDVQFNGNDAEVSFNGAKFGHLAHFKNALFRGPVDFIAANIGLDLNADGAKFVNENQVARFNSVKIGRMASFQKSLFEGGLDFTVAEVTTNFNASAAQFRSKTKCIDLGMRCGRTGSFTEVVFAGPVSFADSSFVDLLITAKAGTPPVPKIDLSRGAIKRQLRIEKTQIMDLMASSLHVEGPAELTNVTVKHSADLSYGEFAKLDLSRSVWPKDAGQFRLQGMSYKYLGAASNEPDSHDALLELVNQSAYTADVYGNLEQFFLRQGYHDDADRAFIAGKCRERDETLRRWGWLYSWFVYLLSAYGRRPWQAGVPCMLCVAIGCFLFSPTKMAPRNSDAILPYNRFWYSLGLFFPLVDLRVDKEWQPGPKHSSLLHYIPFHILLGWILVPIAVAALTGLLK